MLYERASDLVHHASMRSPISTRSGPEIVADLVEQNALRHLSHGVTSVGDAVVMPESAEMYRLRGRAQQAAHRDPPDARRQRLLRRARGRRQRRLPPGRRLRPAARRNRQAVHGPGLSLERAAQVPCRRHVRGCRRALLQPGRGRSARAQRRLAWPADSDSLPRQPCHRAGPQHLRARPARGSRAATPATGSSTSSSPIPARWNAPPRWA